MNGHRENGLFMPCPELFYKMLNLCAELTQSSNSGQFLLFSMIGHRGRFFMYPGTVTLCILLSKKISGK